jgi:hypothetical protein
VDAILSSIKDSIKSSLQILPPADTWVGIFLCLVICLCHTKEC